MANNYYGLMEAMQRPQQIKQQRRQEQMDTVGKFLMQIGQAVVQQKAQENIEKMVKDAEAEGKKVSYQIDPNTGMIAPTISSQSYESIFEAAKAQPEKYEVGRGSKGQPVLKEKKQIKSSLIEGMKGVIQGEGNNLWPRTKIKNPVTGEEETIDITNEEDITRALGYHNIEDWRKNPELVEAGIPELYDKRIGEYKTKQTELEAKAEPKVQPFAKGAGRIGGAGAFYKDAVAKYGEDKTSKIVDNIVKLQKQGKTLKQIRSMLEEAGADADAFLKPYGK